MNKAYTFCLNCGKLQVRTDILENLNDTYIILDKKIKCPKCSKSTKHAATKNIKTLSKKINKENKRDRQILNLIGR